MCSQPLGMDNEIIWTEKRKNQGRMPRILLLTCWDLHTSDLLLVKCRNHGHPKKTLVLSTQQIFLSTLSAVKMLNKTYLLFDHLIVSVHADDSMNNRLK